MLESALVEIPFAAGIDRKTNAKLVLPGKLLALQNGIFKEGGTITKRPGYTALGRSVLGGSDLDSGEALARFSVGARSGDRVDELLLFDAGSLYSYAEGLDAWVDKGNAVPLLLESETVIRNTYAQSKPDAATLNGITVYAWEDGRGGVRATVVDEETGNPILSDVSIATNGSLPRCIGVGTHLFVVFVANVVESGTYAVVSRRLDTESPTAFEASVTLASDVTTTVADQHLDVSKSNYHADAVVFAYTKAGAIRVGYLTEDGVVGGPFNGHQSPVTISVTASAALSLVSSSAGDVYVLYSDGTNAMALARNGSDLSQKIAPTLVAAGNYENITGVFETSSSLRVFWEAQAAQTYNRIVYGSTFNATTLASTGDVVQVLGSAGLASKAFLQGSEAYVWCAHDTTLQATNFLVKADGFIVGKSLPTEAGGIQSKQLPSVVAKSATVFFWACQRKTRFVTEATPGGDSTTSFSLTGISRGTITFSGAYKTAQLGGSLHIAGGVVSVYDGQSIVEAGFHLFPENITLAASAGGSLAAGTYQLCIVFRWTDSKGQVYRSAPSVPVSITVTANQKITATIPTLKITGKQAPRTNVEIECYSTEANGSVFYKTAHNGGSITTPVYNNPATNTVSFIRTHADASIIVNEILYTQGGVIENIAPPAAAYLCAAKGRLWAVGCEDAYETLYSKRVVAGEAPAWSDLFRFRVDPEGGPLKAVAELDDKVIFFQRDAIYFVAGEGPDDLGGGGGFSDPVLVTTDVGCTETASVALIPEGLVFKSAKGIYLLNRGLQVSYLGAEVEAFNEETITSAVLDEDKNQVRFTTEDGESLVYDYFFKQWSTFTNHSGNGAVLFRGVYHYLRTDGTVYRETPDAYLDAGVDIHMAIETAWLKFAGIQGFQRVRRAAFLGDYYSDHRLQVQVAYDYQPFSERQFSFNPTAALQEETYGDDAVYGESGGVYGGSTDAVYQFRIHLGKQKCQAIKFRIEDVGSNPGRAYSLNALSLEVGLKKGVFPQPAAKSL